MKSVLISIKPEWVAKILNGEKTIEIRKTMPKCELPIDVYIYCTKGDYIGRISKKYVGKVVARFTLNKVEEFDSKSFIDVANKTCVLNPHTCETKSSCLSYSEIRDYCKDGIGYAWHISDLGIYTEPKELNEFYTLKCNQKKRPCNIKDVFGVVECHRLCKMCKPLSKAPQSWCYVEEREDAE